MKRITQLAKHLTHGSEPRAIKPRSRLNRLQARLHVHESIKNASCAISNIGRTNIQAHVMLRQFVALGQSLKHLMSMAFALWRNLSTQM